jgi:hypothetical protein
MYYSFFLCLCVYVYIYTELYELNFLIFVPENEEAFRFKRRKRGSQSQRRKRGSQSHEEEKAE